MAPSSVQAVCGAGPGETVAVYFGKSAVRGFGNTVQEGRLDSSVGLLA